METIEAWAFFDEDIGDLSVCLGSGGGDLRLGSANVLALGEQADYSDARILFHSTARTNDQEADEKRKKEANECLRT